jgi:citrate lyase subunit beta/citryl-CoA lyase
VNAVDVLRSLLLVPATREDLLDHALERHADAIVIDLHESVAPPDKDRAREAARAAVARLTNDHTGIWVRINPSQRLLAKADLRGVVGAGLAGVILPRAVSKNHIRYVEGLIRDAEQQHGVEAGAIKLIAIVESAAGLLACAEIAHATPRLVALAFGAEEYCADLGVERSPEGHELQHPRGHIAVCARAAGLLAIDTAFPHPRDEVGLRADAEAARLAGFHGKLAVDGAQVPTINAIFRPTPTSVEYARRVVVAHAEAEAQGHDATQIDGRLIDRPAAERARRLIDLATAIEAREAQSGV